MMLVKPTIHQNTVAGLTVAVGEVQMETLPQEANLCLCQTLPETEPQPSMISLVNQTETLMDQEL